MTATYQLFFVMFCGVIILTASESFLRDFRAAREWFSYLQRVIRGK
jgi:hypothetical protein